MWKGEALQKILAGLEQDYDEAAGLLAKQLRGGSYHSALRDRTVHLIYDSLCYACCLLDAGSPAQCRRAVEIVERVLSCQDTDESRPTYGVYANYLEEPVWTVPAPDMNQADFCTKEFIYILLYHQDKIPAPVQQEIREAIRRSCREIQKRDVYYDYTNISMMAVYVLYVGGELLGDRELMEFGKQKLRALYTYNARCGNFVEYNSPTYTGIAIEEISRMRRDIRDPECALWIERLNTMLWRTMAVHFHAQTKQWAGPHGRAYTDFTKRNLIFIQYASRGEIQLLPEAEMVYEPSWNGMEFFCPPEFYSYFRGEHPYITEACVYNADIQRFYEQKAYSWITPECTLGSFSFSDLWNQRRAVMGYFGTVEKPGCVRLRFLHDHFDYASAILNSMQEEGRVIGVVNFCTDGGDTHMNLDVRKTGRIEAGDMRLRLEFQGCQPEMLAAGENQFMIRCGDAAFTFQILGYAFWGQKGFYEITRKKDGGHIDFVLYSHIRRGFTLAGPMYIAFALEAGGGMPAARLSEGKDTVTVESGPMRLTAGKTPKPVKSLAQRRSAVINYMENKSRKGWNT